MSYDSDLIDFCSREKIAATNLGAADSLVDSIEKKYPTSGGRLKLSGLRNYKYAKASNDKIISDFSKFIESLQALTAKTIQIIYIGDSLTENAYSIPIGHLIKFLSCITEIPQSHYLLAKDLSWCISFSFENDMEFGCIEQQ